MSDGLYESINFLPDWYQRQQRARRSRHRQILLAGVLLFGVVLVYNGLRTQYNDLHHYRQALRQQVQATQGQLSEVAKLQTVRGRLTDQLRLHQKLSRPVNLTRLLNTIAHLTPQSVTLESLTTEAVERENRRVVKPGDPASGRKPVIETEKFTVYEISLKGHAPGNVDIANFVGALAQTGLFRNVKMVYAREGRIRDAVTRAFRIDMEVPLDRPYEPLPVEEMAHVE